MKLKVFIIAALVVAWSCAVVFLPEARQALLDAAHWARSEPVLAPPLFVVGFAIAVVLMFPAWLFMVIGGYLFGALLGGLLAFIANLAGSIAAFLLARTLARSRVQRIVSGSPRFHKFDRAVERNGFLAVLLARLALFPYNLMNYACGLTAVPLRHYILGTALGALPVLLANVLIGAGTTDLFASLQGNRVSSWPRAVWLLPAAAVAMLIAVLLIKRLTEALIKNKFGTGSNPHS